MYEENTLHKEDIARFCLSLPGAREDYKWGGVRVFSIVEKKMFALMDLTGQTSHSRSTRNCFWAMSIGPAYVLRRIWRGHTGSAWQTCTR